MIHFPVDYFTRQPFISFLSQPRKNERVNVPLGKTPTDCTEGEAQDEEREEKGEGETREKEGVRGRQRKEERVKGERKKEVSR